MNVVAFWPTCVMIGMCSHSLSTNIQAQLLWKLSDKESGIGCEMALFARLGLGLRRLPALTFTGGLLRI
ncbi:hypothetical protein ELR94_13890 [Salmonella enterica subsp. enterica serovar Oranienburg]|nr:hypothetical protein [Salmonella enterica subsp. enterica serovar Oranienburg]